MALTQISTAGVKDDAISAGKIPANAVGSSEIADDAVGAAQIADDGVTQSAVADEAIDEARLQISNAGSNGQFLQKQSGNTGGLTWAAANQYTHPKHSGEVTSSADGATTIASNIVDEDNLKISNAGTNGQYLQKQSGNTGGLTWADVSAGSTVDLVADGALAIDDAVYVTSAGKAKKIATAVTENTPIVLGSNSGIKTNATDGQKVPSICHDTNQNRVHYTYGDGGSNVLRILNNKLDSNFQIKNTTYDVLHTLKSAVCDHTKLVYDPNTQRILCLYVHSSTLKAVVISFTESGDGGSYTVGSEVTIHNSSATGVDAVYDPTSNKIFAMWSEPSNSGSGACKLLTIDTSGTAPGTVTVGDLHRFEDSSSARYGSCIKDPDSGKFIIAFSKGSNGQLHMQTATISSGNNMTFGTQVGCTDNSSAGHWHPRMCYDTVNDLIVCLYNSESGSNSGVRRLIAASVSGTDITFKTPDNLGSTWGANECGHHDINWDPSINKAIAWHVDAGSSWYLMANKVYHSGNSSDQYTYETKITVQGANQEQQSERTLNDAIYVGGGQHFLYGKQNSDNYGYLHSVSAGTTTLNSNGFDNIGFSKAAYSDGANATIKTVGNIVNNQSGLTIGANYFLQNDGSYATTRQLGFGGFRAISATSGIITSGANHNTYGSVLDEWFMSATNQYVKMSGSTYLNDNNWNNISGNSNVEMKQVALHQGQKGISWTGGDKSNITFPETGKWKLEWMGYLSDCYDVVEFEIFRSTNGSSGPWEVQGQQYVRAGGGGRENPFYITAYLDIDDTTKNVCSVKCKGSGNSTNTRIKAAGNHRQAGNKLVFTKIS